MNDSDEFCLKFLTQLEKLSETDFNRLRLVLKPCWGDVDEDGAVKPRAAQLIQWAESHPNGSQVSLVWQKYEGLFPPPKDEPSPDDTTVVPFISPRPKPLPADELKDVQLFFDHLRKIETLSGYCASWRKNNPSTASGAVRPLLVSLVGNRFSGMNYFKKRLEPSSATQAGARNAPRFAGYSIHTSIEHMDSTWPVRDCCARLLGVFRGKLQPAIDSATDLRSFLTLIDSTPQPPSACLALFLQDKVEKLPRLESHLEDLSRVFNDALQDCRTLRLMVFHRLQLPEPVRGWRAFWPLRSKISTDPHDLEQPLKDAGWNPLIFDDLSEADVETHFDDDNLRATGWRRQLFPDDNTTRCFDELLKAFEEFQHGKLNQGHSA